MKEGDEYEVAELKIGNGNQGIRYVQVRERHGPRDADRTAERRTRKTDKKATTSQSQTPGNGALQIVDLRIPY